MLYFTKIDEFLPGILMRKKQLILIWFVDATIFRIKASVNKSLSGMLLRYDELSTWQDKILNADAKSILVIVYRLYKES